MASICGQSGLGDDGLYSKCNFLKPGSTGGQYPEYIQLKKGTEGYNTDWNNFAPSASVAWRPNVQDGLPPDAPRRPGPGDHSRRLLGRVRAPGPDEVHDPVRRQRGAQHPADPQRQFRPGAGGAVVAGSPLSEGPPVLRVVQSGSRPTRSWFARAASTASRPSRRTSRSRVSRTGWSASRGRSRRTRRSRFATSATRATTSGRRSTTTASAPRTSSRTGSSTSSSWRWPISPPTTPSGGSRTGSFAYYGAGHGHQPAADLPRLPHRQDGLRRTRRPTRAGRRRSRTPRSPAGWRRRTPTPTTAAGDLDGTATRRTNAANAGYPANFFVLNPAVNEANVTDSGAFSDYHALQFEVRRRLSQGLSANVNYQYAFKEGGSAFDGFSYGRTNTPTANVRHAIKFQADWTLPFGRGQRFGADMNRGLDADRGRVERQRGRPRADGPAGLRQRAAGRDGRRTNSRRCTSTTTARIRPPA